MNEHPDRVTLDDLAALDDEIAGIEQSMQELRSELAEAGYVLARARARQHLMIARYRDQAARPLVDGAGFPMSPAPLLDDAAYREHRR